jgi:hypothetical protein
MRQDSTTLKVLLLQHLFFALTFGDTPIATDF